MREIDESTRWPLIHESIIIPLEIRNHKRPAPWYCRIEQFDLGFYFGCSVGAIGAIAYAITNTFLFGR